MKYLGEANKRWRREQPAALPLTKHTYRHPSNCPVLRHASQEDADGFTLDAALYPLFLRLFPQPSCLHLSAICSIPLSSSLPCCLAFSLILLFSHSCFTYSCQCFGCAVQKSYSHDLQESIGKDTLCKNGSFLIWSIHLLWQQKGLSFVSVHFEFGNNTVIWKANTLWHTTDPQW